MSFDVRSGSVHALCGENGAGKSTLLKILSGAYAADAGMVVVAGTPVAFRSPHHALRSGIAVIYQELHLVPEMTVAENIFLGHTPNRGGIIDRAEMDRRARSLLREVGVDADPSTRTGRLSIAHRQMVEIAKALSHDAFVIAFDEPTSSLSAREVDALFAIIARLKATGRAIVYVSHRMEEILTICDAATVLRDGRLVETYSTLGEVDANTLISRMVGRSIEDIYGYTERSFGEVVLEVDGLTGIGLREPCSLRVTGGEIVGLFGLVGAGRTELLKAIYAVSRSTGAVRVCGQSAKRRSPQDAIRAGLAFCPEDRKKEGIFPIASVMENMNVSSRRRFSRLGFLIDSAREWANAAEQVELLSIRTPSLKQPVQLLSGGNQQKVILGRLLSERARVLMLDEPTRGIDVGAKREIYGIVHDLARKGIGILLSTSELLEALGMCDRVLVMRQGRIVADVPRKNATEKMLLELALPATERDGNAA